MHSKHFNWKAIQWNFYEFVLAVHFCACSRLQQLLPAHWHSAISGQLLVRPSSDASVVLRHRTSAGAMLLHPCLPTWLNKFVSEAKWRESVPTSSGYKLQKLVSDTQGASVSRGLIDSRPRTAAPHCNSARRGAAPIPPTVRLGPTTEHSVSRFRWYSRKTFLYPLCGCTSFTENEASVHMGYAKPVHTHTNPLVTWLAGRRRVGTCQMLFGIYVEQILLLFFSWVISNRTAAVPWHLTRQIFESCSLQF